MANKKYAILPDGYEIVKTGTVSAGDLLANLDSWVEANETGTVRIGDDVEDCYGVARVANPARATDA